MPDATPEVTWERPYSPFRMAEVPEPVRIIATYLDYSPSRDLPGPSSAVLMTAAQLWDDLKAKGYVSDKPALVSDEGR